MKCIVTNWDYMDSLCRRVAEEIREDGFSPDVIVALAKGGWFAGNILCDLLGIPELVSVRVEHYAGIEEKKLSVNAAALSELEGRRVLIVDDVANTGQSISVAKDYAEKNGAAEIKTAVLQLIYTSSFTPDYFGEYVVEDAWIVFPWNFYEDMIDIIGKLMSERDTDWSEWDIKWGLYMKHGIEPTSLEIAQPGKLRDVLSEMVRRGIAMQVEKGGKLFWRLKK
ncbi:phosphoribosyltransferase [Archaeoglobus veneficus]|uniref:Phosphoribosyltransferase n=1 Tax=Archaeoglobus veneficus (strain DSM 11195 / SNP6) TaxID=693661 RepID=F2KT75_ARCVS|nr:phosphoribosyltransferase family protein [Archaeoglobus veneficus]AEA47105.1 phosphoribosyltransferase [Archaeoglobus veneficus SNP6]